MSKRLVLIGLAIAGVCFAGVQSHPASAALIDKLVIKNDTSDNPIFYNITKSNGLTESGCLQHRQTHTGSFLFKPTRVEIAAYVKSCHVGSNAYDKAFNYWAPETTYTVSGSAHSKSINVSVHH